MKRSEDRWGVVTETENVKAREWRGRGDTGEHTLSKGRKTHHSKTFWLHRALAHYDFMLWCYELLNELENKYKSWANWYCSIQPWNVMSSNDTNIWLKCNNKHIRGFQNTERGQHPLYSNDLFRRGNKPQNKISGNTKKHKQMSQTTNETN